MIEYKLYCPFCGNSHFSSNINWIKSSKFTICFLLMGWTFLTAYVGCNKIRIHCLNCGAKLKPKKLRTHTEKLHKLPKQKKRPDNWSSMNKLFKLDCISIANLNIKRIQIEFMGNIRIILFGLHSIFGENTSF